MADNALGEYLDHTQDRRICYFDPVLTNVAKKTCQHNWGSLTNRQEWLIVIKNVVNKNIIVTI
jgi:hypothetical protein